MLKSSAYRDKSRYFYMTYGIVCHKSAKFYQIRPKIHYAILAFLLKIIPFMPLINIFVNFMIFYQELHILAK